MTAQLNHLATQTDAELTAREKYLTESFLDRCKRDKVSGATRVLAEQRQIVAREMKRRGLPTSLLSQLKGIRFYKPNSGDA